MLTTDRDLFVRTFRRRPGSDPDGNDRVPGPWHIQRPEGRTWCGKMPGRLASARYTRETLPGEAICASCRKAKEAGKPQPYRRR